MNIKNKYNLFKKEKIILNKNYNKKKKELNNYHNLEVNHQKKNKQKEKYILFK